MSEMTNVSSECSLILSKNTGAVYIFRPVKMPAYDGNDDLNAIPFRDRAKKKKKLPTNFELIV